MKMVGVSEYYLGTQVEHIAMGNPFEGAPGAHRRKRRCSHPAVRCLKLARTGTTGAMDHTKRAPSEHYRILHSVWTRNVPELSTVADPQRRNHGDQNPVKRLRVGVVYGGRSSEHEVSLASAASVIANLDRERYEPIALRVERNGQWYLAERAPTIASAAENIESARLGNAHEGRSTRQVHLVAHPSNETLLIVERSQAPGPEAHPAGQTLAKGLALDVIFPIVHGPYGEDGTLQGLLELANVPYVGAGVLASAVGMDKAVMKTLFAAHGLPVVKHQVVWRRDWRTFPDRTLSEVTKQLRFPLFVKPANLGSSVGISRAIDRETLSDAVDLASQFDRKIVIEEGVTHCREIECAVLGNQMPEASVPGEIIPSGEYYDYAAKYLDDKSTTEIPASLSADQITQVRQLAIEAFRAIDGEGMARVDFLLERDTGTLFVNEINTHPGFTTISMFAKLWEASGLSYRTMLDRLITLALERHAEKQDTLTSAPHTTEHEHATDS